LLQQVSNQKNVCALPCKGSFPPQAPVLGKFALAPRPARLLEQSPEPVEQLQVIEGQLERALQDLTDTGPQRGERSIEFNELM